jgi:uncharacterized Zn-finger protein
MRKYVMKNAQGKEAEKATPCPYCGESFKLPMEVVLFGGDVTCPHCGDVFGLESDAADTLISGMEDLRKGMERINRRNR